jgi:hypothetical protein
MHPDWRFWVGALLMAAALALYVLSGEFGVGAAGSFEITIGVIGILAPKYIHRERGSRSIAAIF